MVRHDAESCVLAVSGELSLRSAQAIKGAVSKAFADTGCVLIDVSRLRLAWLPAAQLFPSLLARAQSWPRARLVLYGADATLTRALTALYVTRTVPLAPDETTARELLRQRPQTVARHLDLLPAPSSPRRARAFVRDACIDWQLQPVRDDAVIVASELVANAVRHARTNCRLTIRYDDALALIIAVHDVDPAPLDIGPPERGHGLFIVAAVSEGLWSVTPTTDGKTVWALLPIPSSANHSHVIRRAAYQAVRTVLAHPSGPAGATVAIREVASRATEQYGADSLRDQVADLALSLAETAAPTKPVDEHHPDSAAERTRFDDQ